ncbi:MAG: hypothetical protein M9894_05750 [Planctomycetes bacterium]|nr:hypothetical protein [Planctomycetota bacterium]
MTMALEAVYEQDFLTVRVRLSAQAVSTPGAPDPLKELIMDMDGAGARGGHQEVRLPDHAHLRAILDQRVRDGVLRRTIDKWLKAGSSKRDA